MQINKSKIKISYLDYFQKSPQGKFNNTVLTPKWVLDRTCEIFKIKLLFDPCPPIWPWEMKNNPKFVDALKVDWENNSFVNPPYDDTKKFILKAIEQMHNGKTSFMLIPFKPNCQYFDLVMDNYTTLIIIKPGIKFIDGISKKEYKSPLNVPLCLVQFKAGNKRRFLIQSTVEFCAPNFKPKKNNSKNSTMFFYYD